MSTTTTTTTTTATSKPGPAKATKPAAKTYIATAVGRGGKTNVRKVPTQVHYAVDVADPKAKSEAGRKGWVYRFFADEESANKFAAAHIAKGNDAVVVKAKSTLQA